MASNSIVIIPARGGSKRFPRKNIASLAGKPLISYSITASLAASRVNGVFVTTDDEEIASIAKTCGAEVPFLRPAELAGDHVPADEAVAHMIRVLNKDHGMQPDNIVLIQATSPFVTAAHIDAAIAKLDSEPKLDSVTTMSTVDHRHHPYNLAFVEDNERWEFCFPEERSAARSRQAKPVVLKFCNLFAARKQTFLTHGRFGPTKGAVLVDELYSWDIDYEWQLMMAELMIEKGVINPGNGSLDPS